MRVLILDAGLIEGWRDYALSDGTPAKITATFRTQPDGQGGEYGLDDEGQSIYHRPASSYYFDSIYHRWRRRPRSLN